MKKILSFFTIILICFSFLSCENNCSCSNELPQSISQDEWANAKKYVTLSTGIKMAYIEMGNPNGPNIILQHGMTDNSRSWSLAVPYFVEAGYHIYLPDLRGMGKSDAPDGYYTTITYATDLKAFFDAKGIDKAILAGHSLGSFTVQTFALMFPELCEKIVLLSSIPVKQYQTESLHSVYNAYIDPIGENEHPSDTFMNIWYECTFKENNSTEVEFIKFLNYLKSESKILAKNTWKNIIFGLIASDLGGLYSKFDKSIPVLLLHGDTDTMTKNEYQDELMTYLDIDSNSYKNYLNVGHNIQFEIPNESSNDIITWLNTGSLNNN